MTNEVKFLKQFLDVPLFQSLKSHDGTAEVEEKFEPVHLNDFSSEQIKAEKLFLEEHEQVPGINVCSAYHGGPLDYPKISSTSLANIAEKWDFCFEKLQESKSRRRKRPRNHTTNSDEEVYEQLTGDALNKTEFSFSQDDIEGLPSEPNEEDFLSAVTESSNKAYLHNLELSRLLLSKGDMHSVLKVLGGLSLIRNKLWHYNEHIEMMGQNKLFREPYLEVCQLVDSMSEQILEYHSSLVATTVIHDPASQDWSNSKPFYEGEKISHCIQMWWYFLQGFKTDLWQYLPSKTAQRIYSGVFNSSLSILTTRYLNLSPNPSRMKQFQADITAILLISNEALMSISSSLQRLMIGDKHTSVVKEIHDKCTHLLSALALIGSPLTNLTSAVNDWRKTRNKLKKKNPMSANEIITAWLSILRPDLFKMHLAQMETNAKLIILTKLTANQPEPSWPLLVQTIVSHDLTIAKLIFFHFGAFTPGKKGEQESRPLNEDCGGFQCKCECFGAADNHWPQAVGTGVLKICMEGSRDDNVLLSLMEPLLRKLSKESWDAVGKSEIWNPRKPVCFAAITQLLEPYLLPVLKEFFTLINLGKASNSTATMKHVLTSVHDIVPIIPIQILKLTSFMDKITPQECKPLADSVLTNSIISSLYGTISRLQPILKKQRFAREKSDMIIAFGEALCNLEATPDLLKIQVLADDTLAEENEFRLPNREIDMVTNDFSLMAAELISNELLSDDLGASSLKALYRYFVYPNIAVVLGTIFDV